MEVISWACMSPWEASWAQTWSMAALPGMPSATTIRHPSSSIMPLALHGQVLEPGHGAADHLEGGAEAGAAMPARRWPRAPMSYRANMVSTTPMRSMARILPAGTRGGSEPAGGAGSTRPPAVDKTRPR